jgi:hypothetical protein
VVGSFTSRSDAADDTFAGYTVSRGMAKKG